MGLIGEVLSFMWSTFLFCCVASLFFLLILFLSGLVGEVFEAIRSSRRRKVQMKGLGDAQKAHQKLTDAAAASLKLVLKKMADDMLEKSIRRSNELMVTQMGEDVDAKIMGDSKPFSLPPDEAAEVGGIFMDLELEGRTILKKEDEND